MRMDKSMKIKKFFLIISIILVPFVNGCASITSSSKQNVSIETHSPQGNLIKNCECKISNDKGDWLVSAPNSVSVEKSAKNLQVECKKKGYKTTIIHKKSHTSPAMLANMILPGGTIGALIDHKKGTAYIYPNVIDVVMEPQSRS